MFRAPYAVRGVGSMGRTTWSSANPDDRSRLGLNALAAVVAMPLAMLALVAIDIAIITLIVVVIISALITIIVVIARIRIVVIIIFRN